MLNTSNPNSPLFQKQWPIKLAIAALAIGEGPTTSAQSVEEIIVTGQGGVGAIRLSNVNDAGSRLGLSGFDLPASVDIISQLELATKGDYGALDAVTRTAGVSSSASPGNGGTSISSRGFNGHGSSLYTYDGTRLYIVAGTVTFPADTWTLDRVEVLRGAGSVINGVGAIGTSINYVPKKPSLEGSDFEGLVAGGSFGLKRVAIGGGNNLSDEWAFRVDASFQDEDGFQDRANDSRQVIAGSLLYQPNEDFSMRFSLDYADVEPAAYWGTPLIDGRASRDHRKNNYNFSDGKVEYKDTWSRIHTEWNFTPNITFRNDTYLLDVRREWQNLEEYSYNRATGQIDRAFYLGIIHEEEQVGTRSDFLIDSELNGLAHRINIGAEINQIDLNYLNNFTTGGFGVSDSVPVFGFNPGTLPMTTIPTVLDYQTDTTQFAFFLDDVLELSNTVNLVLGLRYDDIDFDRLDVALAGVPASAFSTSFDELTWRAGLVYQPSDFISLYGQFSTAADPVTSPISISAGNKDWDLATGRQWEVGLKQQFMDGRAEYTLAWFDIEKEDLVTRRPGTAISEQVGQQSSSGIEATLRLNPTDELSLDFNIAAIDAKFDEFFSGGVSLAGNTPNNVPEQTANLWANYSITPNLQLGGGFRYVDSRFADNENTEQMPEYTVWDASLNWEAMENMTVTLRARNLSNEEDYVLAPYVPQQWIFGDPRSYELSVRFGL
jgi:iron complex outermembrane receptor protein